MVKKIRVHLQNAFEDLNANDINKFKNKLRDWKQKPHLRRAVIKSRAVDPISLTDLICTTFSMKHAVSVTLEVLRSIGCDEVADDLEKNTKQWKRQPKTSETDGQASEFSRQGVQSRSDLHNEPELRGIVHQYQLSVRQKYESEQRFLSVKIPRSVLCIEPVIVQKNENGSFKIIRLDSLLVTHTPMNIVLQGDSGSGKSFVAQKILLDWASERTIYNNFSIVFYLRCEELKCISEEMTLIELLSESCSLTSDQISKILQQLPKKMLFIIDGFDELRLTQDIYDRSVLIDPLQKAPPEVTVTALLRRCLFPESTLLITARSENTLKKLLKGTQCFTKILGFSPHDLKSYFRMYLMKGCDSEETNQAVFTACTKPVICWIISEMLRVASDITQRLETTTSIYIDYVFTLLEHHCQGLSQSALTLLRTLSQLTERGMLEQQVVLDSDPAEKPFLSKFLCSRKIHQETVYSFGHRSFQEFFSALYYVLLDEVESKRKVKELLHTVERGWALSCWSDRDFSLADVEIRCSEVLQPVVLFLCGLCKKDSNPSFFEKHNMAFSVSIETQLKEWISRCSQRCQNELLLFILHCLFELHQKSFTANVLESLILIDLSNMPLNMTDCWTLKYCLQCCEHTRKLKLQVTSEDLKMLKPELYKCKELWLMMNHISANDVDLISAAGKGNSLKKLDIKIKSHERYSHPVITVSVREEDITVQSLSRSQITLSAIEFTLTSPISVISTIKWIKTQDCVFGHPETMDDQMLFLRSLFGLKKLSLPVSYLTESFARVCLSLIQNCDSLIELRFFQEDESNICKDFRKAFQIHSRLLNSWTLTVWGKSVLIKKRFRQKPETNISQSQMGRHPKYFGARSSRVIVQDEEPSTSFFTPLGFLRSQMFTEPEDTNQDSSNSSTPEQDFSGEVSDSYSSSRAESFRAQTSSKNAEMFTPELIQKGDEDKHKKTYRFLCPHAGRFECSLTSLVFVMEGEGELLYRVVSWDPRLLDGLGQMQPAGPLFDIDCSADDNRDGLAVAHLTGDNMEIMQPLKVTEAHVVIDIRDLSLFGLLWTKIFGRLISGQVLLFIRTLPIEEREKILHVHLLPWNVPVSEVQLSHQDKKYIETTSKCHLFLGREYSMCCQPDGFDVQPESEIFEHNNFGPNYHPTFEVFLNIDVKKIGLSILDTAERKNVWSRSRILLTVAPSQEVELLERRMAPEYGFVDAFRDELIQRVSTVLAIADSLKSKRMITEEMWNEVRAANTNQNKMRCLFTALDSGGASVKAEFYSLLRENEPYLVDELEAGPSRPQ